LSSDDPQEFASNILKLAGSPILRAYMGERARLESERFSLETSAQLVLQKFEQLIEAKLDIA
jgi:glycosyltransferase involved in cell wall biosynthesis